MSNKLFCYGTLMNKTVTNTVIRRKVAEPTHELEMIPAVLPQHKRTQVIGELYPCAFKTGDDRDSINGMLIKGLTDKDIRFLDWFEDEYDRVPVSVKLEDGTIEKNVYFYHWKDEFRDKVHDEDWDDSWLTDDEKVQKWMAKFIENLPTFDDDQE